MIISSGSGVQMQSTSYLSPGYYRVIDQNVGGNGSLWQVMSNGTACQIGRVYNVVPEPSGNDDILLSYNKEMLKQIMLKHEAIFRNQVHELHRLYGRQRELMNEISRNHIKIEAPQSNLILSQMQCNIISQNALQVPRPLLDVKPIGQGRDQMPSTSDSVKNSQTESRIYLKENTSEEQRVPSSKSHYYGKKKVFDLELPAEEYIDSEDEDGLEERNSVQVPQLQDNPSKTASQFPTKSDLNLNDASSPNGSSNYSKTTFLFDLNEPIQLDGSETPISAHFIASSTEMVPPDQNSFRKSISESPARNEESAYNVLEGKGNEGSSLISSLQDSSAGGLPFLCGDRNSLVSEVPEKDNEILDENKRSMLSSCLTNSLSPVVIYNEAKTDASISVSSRRISPDIVPEKDKEILDDNNQSMLSSCLTDSCSPVVISNEVKTDASISVSSQRISFDIVQALPCFNNPDFLSKGSRLSTPSIGIKRKYYNSKKNRARSASLGSVSCCITSNSDIEHAAEDGSLSDCIKDLNHTKSAGKKNQIETKRTIYLNEDLDRVAAEAIVSISSLGIQQCLKNYDESEILEVSGDCLSWFAGLVSSFTGDSEIEFETLSNDDTSSSDHHHNVLPSSESEHIEAMAFKLTGIKIEDQCPESLNQKSKTRHHEEKGRHRKTRQRKYISSLPSAYVTENLEQTEKLIMAAGSRRTSVSIKGQRNVGRAGRRRRSVKMVSSREGERKVCSVFKQHTLENELSFTLTSLLGWGGKHRRQKSRRARGNYCFHFD